MAIVKYHERNQALFVGLEDANGHIGTTNGSIVLTTVAITGTAGEFSCDAANLYIGQELTISGTAGGTGSIVGYTDPTTYYIVATNNSTTFQLSLTREGTPITTTIGTPTGLTYTIGILGATSGVAFISEPTADPTRSTAAFQFYGDNLSRDEYTYEKDKYVDLTVETMQQVLSDLSVAIDPNTNSIWKMLQACGGFVSVDASTKYVSAGNNVDSPDYLQVDYRKSSSDDVTYDKLAKYTNLRGTVDVNASLGDMPKLKFSLKGNATNPVKAAKLASETIRVAQLALLDDTFTSAGTVSGIVYTSDGKAVVTFSAPHGLTVGNIITVQVAGATPTSLNGNFVALIDGASTVSYFVKGLTSSGSATGTITCGKGDTAVATLCFSTLAAPNFYGFDLTRYQTGCDTGFAKGAVPTDITVGMLEDQVGGTSFNPDANITKFYGVYLQFSDSANTAGKKVAYLWNKAQIANVKAGKVGTYLGRDITFRNTGQSFMFWS